MSGFSDRYGIPSHEVKNLHSRFAKQKLIKGFGSFDNYLKFCADSGYVPGMLMAKYNRYEPHSPNNTYFKERPNGHLLPRTPKKKQQTRNWLCNGCPECADPKRGCKKYREMFVKNWDENIHYVKPEPVVESPNKKHFFQYEHPDLVREGTLQIYSEDFIAYKTDTHFARAVTEAVSLLISQGEQIADLENKISTMNGGWIPTKLGFLPEEHGQYLCNVKSHAFPGSYYPAVLRYNQNGFNCGNICNEDVTHWMPIPDCPNDKTDYEAR